MDNIHDLLQEAKKKSLSSDELLNLVKHKANLMVYSELTKYNDLDKAMGKYGCLILLYETKKNYGHWTCIIKRKSINTNKIIIEHFDSYALMPDDELKFVPEYFRDIGKERLPHLTALLYNSGYPIEYNDHKLQEKMIDVNTCGRWVGMRINLKHLPIEEFIKLFKGDKHFNSDDLVTLSTILI